VHIITDCLTSVRSQLSPCLILQISEPVIVVS